MYNKSKVQYSGVCLYTNRLNAAPTLGLNKSIWKMEILNKYGKYTAVNLLVNWNIDKFNNEFKM